MKKIDKNLILKIIQKNWSIEKIFFQIPVDSFKTNNNIMINLYCEWITTDLQNTSKIDWKYDIKYSKQIIIFYRGDLFMKAEFLVRIPYGERSKYFEVINQINSLIDSDGLCGIAVNNVPYNLDSMLFIQTTNNINEIETLIAQANLEKIYDKGINEITHEMKARKWDIFTVMPNQDIKMFAPIFLYPEASTFQEHGYDSNFQVHKKKLFISYCHKDKEKIRSIVDDFKRYGLNVWIDEQEIDLGDNILTKMSTGINECDIAVIFISNHTLQAKTAMYELLTYLRKSINQEKKLLPILLDDTKPDDVIEGLGGYKYYPYYETHNNEELITQIKKVLEKN